MSTATAEDLGKIDVGNGVRLPGVVAFDFRHLCYVDGAGIPLDADTVEALGWDSTLRDIPTQSHSYRPSDDTPKRMTFEQKQLVQMAERDALRDALFSSYAIEDLEPDEYDAINQRVYTVLGERRAERLAIICVDEHMSGEDMMHLAFDVDRMNALLTRLEDEDR